MPETGASAAASSFDFGNSDVQLDAPAHVERLRQVFRAANERGMAIVVHMRRPSPEASVWCRRGQVSSGSCSRRGQCSGPDRHLADRPWLNDPPADSAMAVLADAVVRGTVDPMVLVDVASVVDTGISHARRTGRRADRQVGSSWSSTAR